MSIDEQRLISWEPLFALGKVVITPGAAALLKRSNQSPTGFVILHEHGVWGELDQHDREANERALITNDRILSNYPVNGGKLWVITEADRSVTTLLLPEEY
jgi:hypothetical protein